MLYRMDSISGMSIGANDGDIGKVKDVYFDDHRWAVRYLVVDTGGWLEDRKVLISPYSVENIAWDRHVVELGLSKQQVRNSPDMDTAKPVSRQQELDLFTYYGYPDYWGGPLLWGTTDYPFRLVGGAIVEDLLAEKVADTTPLDPNLRSAGEVNGYHIQATDHPIGHVKDFLVEADTWAIRYVVIDTRNWWPGKTVIIPPQWISRVDWPERLVHVTVTREQVKAAPEFDLAASLTREAEERLHRHYERPGYWSGRSNQ